MLNEKLRASCAIDTIVGQNSAPPACHKQSTGFALSCASGEPPSGWKKKPSSGSAIVAPERRHVAPQSAPHEHPAPMGMAEA